MIFTAVEDALFFQFTDFRGKSATVNIEIICKLLAVKWDIERVTVGSFGLKHEVSQEFFSC